MWQDFPGQSKETHKCTTRKRKAFCWMMAAQGGTFPWNSDFWKGIKNISNSHSNLGSNILYRLLWKHCRVGPTLFTWRTKGGTQEGTLCLPTGLSEVGKSLYLYPAVTWASVYLNPCLHLLRVEEFLKTVVGMLTSQTGALALQWIPVKKFYVYPLALWSLWVLLATWSTLWLKHHNVKQTALFRWWTQQTVPDVPHSGVLGFAT